MIHAYLFVTANNKDRDGHGPEFCKHMHRINAEAGTNITVSNIFWFVLGCTQSTLFLNYDCYFAMHIIIFTNIVN